MKLRDQETTKKLSEIGYDLSYRGETSYPYFDKLMLMIASGKVTKILVDFRQRLRIRKYTDDFFLNLCSQFGVEIVEFGSYVPDDDPRDNRIIIYHNTDGSRYRVKYMLNDIDEIYNAVRLCGRTANAIYIDETRVESKRVNYEYVKGMIKSGDVVVVKSILNLSVKLMNAIRTMDLLKGKGVELYSLMDGDISIHDKHDILNAGLRVVIYDSFSKPPAEYELTRSRLELFVKYRTGWQIVSDMYEGGRVQKANGHTKLNALLDNQDNYEAIVVSTYKRISINSCEFRKILNRLDEDKLIFSLEEGGYLRGKKKKSGVLCPGID